MYASVRRDEPARRLIQTRVVPETGYVGQHIAVRVDDDGPGADAEFYGLEGLAVSADGTTVYVADGNNGDSALYHRVRELVVPAP